MIKIDGKIAGILGAIILHLIAAIIFMVVKIGELNVDKRTKEYQIALEEIPVPEKKVTVEDQQGTSIEKIFKGDQEILNIARNIANQPDVKINRSDYIDKVKEELIAAGKLGKDNYIDEQKKAREDVQGSNLIIEKKEDQKSSENQQASRQMAANYSGPTRIYYNLPGRTHAYMPVPIYKCEGSGKAVLTIEVDQKGNVLSAKIITAESTTSDPCLTDAAISSALVSKFNPDINAMKIQKGTITYLFVAQ
jgi:hypothetical protein